MKKILLYLLFICVANSLYAINPDPIKGRVIDETSQPLAGVTVIVKEDPYKGTTTDAKGLFSITMPNGAKTLIFKFLGMKDQTIEVKDPLKSLEVKMVAVADQVDEIVITGYAQTTRKMVTGSVGVLDKELFANKSQSSVDALLQGQLAGVSVSAVSGQPGKSQQIKIRGTNTLSGDSEPLWVIDGVPMQGSIPNVPTSSELKAGSFDNLLVTGVAGINPNDIESITVLKDASAAAIYGSRAAGGVIVVTTKRGSSGPLRVNYAANVSVLMSPQRDANLMNSREKLEYEQGLWNEFSSPKIGSKRVPYIGITGAVRGGLGKYAAMSIAEQDAYLNELAGVNTDWYEMLFRNSISTNHHLALSGGSEKYNYYSSVGYTKDAGLVKNNNLDRYNVKGNVTIKPNDRISVDMGVDLVYQDSKAPAFESVDPFRYAYFANPYEQPFDTDGNYRADETYYSIRENNSAPGSYIKPTVPKSGFNIIREMDETSSNTKKTSSTVRAGLNVKLFSKLSFIGLASYSFVNNRTENIYGKQTKAAFDNRLSIDKSTYKEYSSISQSVNNNSSYVVRGHFNYVDSYGPNHQINILAGSELRGDKSDMLFSKRFGYDQATGNSSTPIPPPNLSGSIGYEDLKAYMSAMDKTHGQIIDESRYASFYASADYYIKNRYIFNASFRTDGSSNFGSDEQFNPTWSAGVAWHVMEEEFMIRARPILNALSLRVAMGYTGNVNRTYLPQVVVEYDEDEYRNYDGEIYNLGSIINAPNPRLRWEKTKDFKVSLDFGLFENRLTGLVEGYFRNSTDVVRAVQVLASTGFSKQGYNSVDIANNGVEFTFSGDCFAKDRDFGLKIGVNMAFNQNIITRYNPAYASMSIGEYWQGYPVSPFFSGLCEGIDPVTGIYAFKLRPDAVIKKGSDLNDPNNYRYYLGTSIAPITGGLNIMLSYKTFKLSVGGVLSLGAKDDDIIKSVVNFTSIGAGLTQVATTQTDLNDLYSQHLNVRKTAADRWTPTNTTGQSPRVWDVFDKKLEFGDNVPTDVEIARGAFLADLSYFRIKNIVLSYDIPRPILQRAKIQSVGFSLALNNFFTFTNYKGMDPETPGATYPLSRSVTFGVNIGF